MQKLTHGVADGDGFFVGMLGDNARIESADGGIESHGAEGGHPEITAHQIVAARRSPFGNFSDLHSRARDTCVTCLF